jgi:hypothetical protein
MPDRAYDGLDLQIVCIGIKTTAGGKIFAILMCPENQTYI